MGGGGWAEEIKRLLSQVERPSWAASKRGVELGRVPSELAPWPASSQRLLRRGQLSIAIIITCHMKENHWGLILLSSDVSTIEPVLFLDVSRDAALLQCSWSRAFRIGVRLGKTMVTRFRV